MANEISASINVTVTKGSYTRTITPSGLFTQNTQGESAGIMALTTTKAAVPLGSLTTANQGWAFFFNLDPTNVVDIGIDDSGTFAPLVQLQPGEFALFRLKQNKTVQALAETATANLQYIIWEN